MYLNGSASINIERIQGIRNAFQAAREQLCAQCFQLAHQNDMDSIRELMSQMVIISARLRALNRFLDDAFHDSP